MQVEGRWVYQEQGVRHAFSLCRVLDAGTFDQSYDLLGVVQVAVDRRRPEKLSAGLRPWALATLASGGYGFGRFYAAFTTLDEDGEPYRSIAEEYVDWSGTEVLVPAAPLPGPDGSE
ncbi:hypothetical protein GA0074692_1919 [Micromonospora pallida]|uniref:Uncharacterized protein n=1 Tax=Micromonospora pallida TaxID=145854 RepID=A0A1C6S6Y0_9ACTN|nr:hypothetical protein [Micromonospora pallida]SCL25226.1 hypothetical protein GA0074692_1919 [Micromonospora pallida]